MTAQHPFVDRPVGPIDPARLLASELAGRLGLPSPTLLRLGMNALFRTGDAVIRVGRPTAPPERAVDMARALTAHRIAVAQPFTDLAVSDETGLTATAWQAVEAVSDRVDWRAVGGIVRRLHSLDRTVLPAEYPTPSPVSFPWWDFDALLADVGGDIDRVALESIESTIAHHRGWDRFENVVVCHGDVHPGNVIMSESGPVLLDWDLMCVAAPGWDHAMLLTLASRWGGDADVYRSFAEGYGASLVGHPETERLAALRNVAATLMRVRAGRDDPTAAIEAERRLRYWRGEPDAPAWQAQ